LQEIRDKEAADEKIKVSAENAVHMVKIQAELDACKEMKKKGPRAFIEHLNKTLLKDDPLPLSKKNFESDKMGKTIMRVINRTHPDKHVEKERHI
jgi:hypothetical protein